jgi:DHA1 family multidrug resistance protein-like MFS transporter
MTTQLRDTQFGHLVRILSNNRLFRYPDEIEPLLWKKRTSPQLDGQYDETEILEGLDDSNHTSTKDFDLQNPNLNHVVDGGKDIHLVDWFGKDDPEVCSSFYSVQT